jgi:hypothetical protein
MNAFKGKLTIGVMVLVGLLSANALSDTMDYLTVNHWGWIKEDLYVDGDFDLLGALFARANVYVWDDLDVGGDLDVDGNIGLYSGPAGYFAGLTVADYAHFQCDIETSGKVESVGGYDPPYVLYDRQTRQEIIDRIKKEVHPDKQAGAALFFNRDTRRLETYVPSEGKFYDLQGNVVYELSEAVEPTTRYEIVFYLDGSTGELKTRARAVRDRYVVKNGHRLDEKTGRFISRVTSEPVPREEALEFYVVSEGAYYDVQGHLIRSEASEKQIEYKTEYHFDRLTGDVTPIRKPVRNLFVIRKGFTFNKQTGEFVDEATGEVVPKEMAIEVKPAS